MFLKLNVWQGEALLDVTLTPPCRLFETQLWLKLRDISLVFSQNSMLLLKLTYILGSFCLSAYFPQTLIFLKGNGICLFLIHLHLTC